MTSDRQTSCSDLWVKWRGGTWYWSWLVQEWPPLTKSPSLLYKELLKRFIELIILDSWPFRLGIWILLNTCRISHCAVLIFFFLAIGIKNRIKTHEIANSSEFRYSMTVQDLLKSMGLKGTVTSSPSSSFPKAWKVIEKNTSLTSSQTSVQFSPRYTKCSQTFVNWTFDVTRENVQLKRF